MEPRRDDGDDLVGSEDAGASMPPQWSPAVTTGMTGLVRNAPGVEKPGPAMEPRRDDGDDFDVPAVGLAEERPAMEPRRDDGDDGTQQKG